MLAALTGGRRFRWIVYAIVAVVLLRTDFLGIFLGYVLCDFMCTDWNWKQWLCGNRILNWLMFAVGLYLCVIRLQVLATKELCGESFLSYS